jgi:hypothetical protein
MAGSSSFVTGDSLRSLNKDNGKERWRTQEHPANYPPMQSPSPQRARSAADRERSMKRSTGDRSRRRPPLPTAAAIEIVEQTLARESLLDRAASHADRRTTTAGGLPTFHDRRPSCTNGVMTI